MSVQNHTCTCTCTNASTCMFAFYSSLTLYKMVSQSLYCVVLVNNCLKCSDLFAKQSFTVSHNCVHFLIILTVTDVLLFDGASLVHTYMYTSRIIYRLFCTRLCLNTMMYPGRMTHVSCTMATKSRHCIDSIQSIYTIESVIYM